MPKPFENVSSNDPRAEQAREEILNAALSPQNWSADGRAVFIRAVSGWFVLAERVEDGLVSFHARKGSDRYTFWMNASSVSNIGAALRAAPERKWQWPGLDRAFGFVAGGAR